MIQKLLHSQAKSISSASLILAASYLISAVLGLTRDRLLAGNLGLGSELDVYYTAFTVPDFIALILIFGAISAAVIPIFSSYLLKSKKDAWEYASIIFNVFLGFLILVCVGCMFITPFFISVIAPGFAGEKRELAIMLMRIMFLSPIILGASNIISGILQVYHRFLVTALAPVMYNAGIIVGILFFYPIMGVTGLAWGVVLGGCMHLLIQLPSFFFSGFHYKFNFNYNHEGVKKTLQLMVPRSLGLGAGQLNTIAITSIASTLIAGSIATFNLANNLASIMVNTVAVSLSTASFPSMSMAFLQNEEEKFLSKFSQIFRQTIFLVIPISVLIILLRAQIVRVILGAGKVTWADTRLMSACLGILAASLFAQGLIFILSKTFYAAHNTKIPAVISVLTVLFNIVLSLSLVWLTSTSEGFALFIQSIFRLENVKNIGVIGLSLSFSITAIIEALLLVYFLYRKFPKLKIKEMSDSLMKILAASAALIAATLLMRQALVVFNLLTLETFWEVFLQLVLSAGSGVFAYITVSLLMKSEEIKTIKDAFLKRFLY